MLIRENYTGIDSGEVITSEFFKCRPSPTCVLGAYDTTIAWAGYKGSIVCHT